MKSFWLAKSEPETFSWDDLVRDQKTIWDGVRNYAARNNIRAMKVGDFVLIYHSVTEKCIAGLAQVSSEPFSDPSDPSNTWTAVEMIPLQPVKNKLTLSEIKQDPFLEDMLLVKNSRLSVQPVNQDVFLHICSKTGLTPII
jgi:predicted RNA-binding protein with PUA-like domain